MSDWLIDYNNGLFLQIPPTFAEGFCSTSFYKLKLKRFSKSMGGSVLLFRNSLTYLDFKRIISICEQEASKGNFILHIGQALKDYINAKEMHLESRSRLGTELKKQDTKLQQRFNEYRNIVDSVMSRKLREQQMWDSFFMCAMRKSGNFSVPGSGKTASVLGIYAYLKAQGLIKRIVVICPKNAFGSWMDEFSVCFKDIEQLNCFNIHSAIYQNASAKKRALRFDTGNCNLFLLNFESLDTYMSEIKDIVENETLLVFDEVHKVKRIEGLYAMGAREVAQNAYYVVAMTGTPIPNSYTDIYNFLQILFPDDYDIFFNFTPAQLRKPSATEITVINDKLQPFFCRTTKGQLGVPDVNADEIICAKASATENRLMHLLKIRYRKNRLALFIRILQLESNPSLLLESLDLNEFRYLLDDTLEVDDIDVADYSEEITALITTASKTTKFCACIQLIMDLVKQGKPVVVWCVFIRSIERIFAELKNYGIAARCIFGEVALEERQQILSDFREGYIQVLITNPHTLAESVSLHSVCHDAIYFEYSYNLVHLLQSKDRIHRLGLPDDQYTQYYYMQSIYDTDDGTWSMGDVIYQRLMKKEQIMLDAIDNHVLENIPTTDEDLDAIFAELFTDNHGSTVNVKTTKPS